MRQGDRGSKDTTTENAFVGSFPGTQRGSRWFSAWGKALLAQAGIWDGVWGKLRDGSYEMKDWYSAVARSVDLAASSLNEMMEIAARRSQSLPWASLSWPATEEVLVYPQLEVVGSPQLTSPFELSRLSAPHTHSPSNLRAYAKWEGSALVVWLDQPSEAPESGEYIGFVHSDAVPAPLAVVTLTIPAPAEDSRG